MSRMSGTIVRQPTFDWKAPDKYHILYSIEIEVRDIVLKNNYTIHESEKVLKIMNGLGCRGPRLVQTLSGVEQEECRTRSGLYEVRKLRPSVMWQ